MRVRQGRAHRSGFTNPIRCDASFHRSRIGADHAAPILWRGT
jgi:hypothetical protein